MEAATYRGYEGIRRYFDTLVGELDEVRIEPEDLIEAGEQVIVTSRMSGRGKDSGAPVDLTLTGVCSLRDGKIVRVRNYPEKGQALDAGGLGRTTSRSCAG